MRGLSKAVNPVKIPTSDPYGQYYKVKLRFKCFFPNIEIVSFVKNHFPLLVNISELSF